MTSRTTSPKWRSTWSTADPDSFVCIEKVNFLSAEKIGFKQIIEERIAEHVQLNDFLFAIKYLLKTHFEVFSPK